jgi:hypothetical protein
VGLQSEIGYSINVCAQTCQTIHNDPLELGLATRSLARWGRGGRAPRDPMANCQTTSCSRSNIVTDDEKSHKKNKRRLYTFEGAISVLSSSGIALFHDVRDEKSVRTAERSREKKEVQSQMDFFVLVVSRDPFCLLGYI